MFIVMFLGKTLDPPKLLVATVELLLDCSREPVATIMYFGILPSIWQGTKYLETDGGKVLG